MTEHPQDMPVTRDVVVPLPNPRLERALDLEFVPTRTLAAVPRRFFEKCFNREFDVKTIGRIYRFADVIVSSPTNLLYVLLHPQTHEIHGFLWAKLDPVESALSVHVFAVDPDYDGGSWVQRVTRWLCAQPFQWEALKPQIAWITDRSEVFRGTGAQMDTVQRVVIARGGDHA